MMTLKESLKKIWFYLTTDPNSPKGLRHRADILVKKGFAQDNLMVVALRKRADLQEKGEL